jgi:acetyl-CoA synthetase
LLELRDDYDLARAAFAWPTADNFNWARDWFDAELAAGYQGSATALKIVGQDACSLTFAELAARSNAVAAGLQALGVQHGDRIMLMLGNCPALWEMMLAAMKIGAITVPTTTLSTSEDVLARIEQAGIVYIVTNSDLAGRLATLPDAVTRIAVGSAIEGWHSYDDLGRGTDPYTPVPSNSDDPILIYFTSGTTARPKLVVHTHRSYGFGSLSTMYWLGLEPGDTHLNVSSPGWAKHAWSNFFAPWAAGACVLIVNQDRFNAPNLLEALGEHNVTSICAPPTVWRMLIQEDLSAYPVTLREICSAGEPLNPEVVEAVESAWGLTIRDGFGQTETTAQIANSPGQHVKAGSVGRPLPGYDVVLLDADDNEVEEGEIALRLASRPAGLMTGYIDAEGSLIPTDGAYYRTGDVASRDTDGWFTYVGRADDVFKASDYRISPFELESALIEHPSIVEAAVVPAPDPVRQAVPKAYISLAAGYDPSEATALGIFQHLASALAPYKRIRRLEFGDLPKTISGKIRRVELRRREIELYSRGERSAGEHREDDFPVLRQERDAAASR